MNANSVENLNRLYGDGSGGNFFQSSCNTDGQVVEGINSDGTYSCVDPSEDVEVENLSETLAAGNLANQTIDVGQDNISFDDYSIYGSNNNGYGGIQIGDSDSYTDDSYDVAIGLGSKADDNWGANSAVIPAGETAIGSYAEATARYTSAFGLHSEANSYGALAIGADGDGDNQGASASGVNSTAIGTDSSASAEGALGIGNSANAPNSYEATFGNLQGQELDVNVTGNLTVHGSGGLDMKGNDINNVNNLEVEGNSGVIARPGADFEVHQDSSSGSPDDRGFNFQIIDDANNVDRINWARETGDGNAFNVYSPDTNDHFFTVEDSGNVTIPNGALTVQGESTFNDKVEFTDSVTLPTDTDRMFDDDGNRRIYINNSGRMELGGGNNEDLITLGGSTSSNVNGQVTIRDSTQQTLVSNEGGNIDIPNGDLDMVNGGDINNVGNIQTYFSTAQLQTAGSGGNEWEIYDSNNAQPIAEFEEGGNVTIPNGDLNTSGNDIKNIGDQNTDLAYDSNDGRMEMNSKGNTDICIGDC